MSNDPSGNSSKTSVSRGFFWGEAAILLLFWLVMSGKYDALHIGFGLIAVGIVMWLQYRSPGSAEEKKDKSLLAHFHRFPFYIPWLSVQMIKATWQVTIIVLSPRMNLDPCVVEFKSAQPHSVARVTLANSITLTPGTLSLKVDGDRYQVHALTGRNADELLEGAIARHIARLFGASGERAAYDGKRLAEFEDD